MRSCSPFVGCLDNYLTFEQYVAACAIDIGGGQFALNLIETTQDSTAASVVNCDFVQGVDPDVQARAVLRGLFTLDYLNRPAMYVNFTSCSEPIG